MTMVQIVVFSLNIDKNDRSKWICETKTSCEMMIVAIKDAGGDGHSHERFSITFRANEESVFAQGVDNFYVRAMKTMEFFLARNPSLMRRSTIARIHFASRARSNVSSTRGPIIFSLTRRMSRTSARMRPR